MAIGLHDIILLDQFFSLLGLLQEFVFVEDMYPNAFVI